ncbi:hypothetical protein F0562_030676 [Nyssa sinensis]|uniref:Uncharacterized protein n=1 Tax=Nyssa sinensis TaxID=561372 RepID=A0A5J5AXJ6_9ASTE|nr:hypothetical protein F0562_030676 [Nyssa sinensis]
MGTELQYAINPLANSQNNNIFAANRLDDWDCLENKGLKENLQTVALDKLQCSMDRMLEQHNLESIKKTMLMHEDIFKQQVRELHRLYKPSKEDIEEDQAGPRQQQGTSKTAKRVVMNQMRKVTVELTLSIGGSTGKKRSKKHQHRRSPDLGCTGLTHNKFRELGSSAFIKSEECGAPDNTLGSSSAALDQQNKRPHWLFRGLSLNRT